MDDKPQEKNNLEAKTDSKTSDKINKTTDPVNPSKNAEDKLKSGEITINQSKEKKVIIHAEAYKSIILYSTRYANASIPREQWREIYGILVGTKSDDAVIVERAIPMTYGESTDVVLGPEHYGFIEEIQNKLDEEGRNRFMVGWFHSHPGLTLFYSYVDISNQIFFQSLNPDFMGIVFDHTYLLDKQYRPSGYEFHPSNLNPTYKITEDHPNHPFKTGIVCYRLNDPQMDVNNPLFETNYHDVDYEILGLDQYFFAQLLTELSSYAAAGVPLEKAYREETAPKYKETQSKSQSKISVKKNIESDNTDIELTEIKNTSLTDKINSLPNVQEEIPSVTQIKETKPIQLPEMRQIEIGSIIRPEILAPAQQKLKTIDQLITEGKTAFYINDSFTAIEKYNLALDSLDKMGPEYSEKMLDVYSDVIESCINTQHDNMAIDFAEKMKEKAESTGDMFQMGNADYFKGICLIRKNNINEGLSFLKNSAILFENSGDFAGVGKSNEEIAEIYYKNNDYESAALFYTEAMKNYFNALKKFHKKRRSSWALPVNLKSKIKKLKEKVNELMEKVPSEQIKAKLKNDMKSISIN